MITPCDQPPLDLDTDIASNRHRPILSLARTDVHTHGLISTLKDRYQYSQTEFCGTPIQSNFARAIGANMIKLDA